MGRSDPAKRKKGQVTTELQLRVVALALQLGCSVVNVALLLLNR